MTKDTQEFVYDYLKTISSLTTKRVEILAFLKVLNNKTYESYEEDRIMIQRLAEKAKKLRVDLKTAQRYKQGISKKGNPLAMLAEVADYAGNILPDILTVKEELIKTHTAMRKQLADANLDGVIQLDLTYPMDDVIRDLTKLVKHHQKVHLAISSKIS